MNDSFDGELRRRLRHYLEEPRMELWQRILTTSQASRRPLSTSGNTKGFWLLVLGLLTVGGLYYFGQTGITPRTSAVLIQTTQPNNASKKGTGTLAKGNDSASDSEIKTPSLIQADERFVPGRDAVEIKSLNTTEPEAVVKKTQDIPKRDVIIIEDEHIVIPENSSPIEVTDFPEILATIDQSTALGDDKSDKNEELSTTAATKNNNDEGKTVIQDKDKRHDKFSIYFTIMPTFGYQRINSNSSDNIIIQSIDRISTFSIDRLGVRAELGVEDPITDRMKFFGGFVYYQRKQTIGYTEKQVESTQLSEGPGGEVIVTPKYAYVDKSFEYELKNLGVQVGLSYALSERKFLQTIGTGFEFHIALNKLEDNPQAPEFTNNPSAYLFYNLYYRLQYPADSRLKAVFQPTLNYSFYINQNLNAPFYVKPYGLGLNLGFTYNF